MKNFHKSNADGCKSRNPITFKRKHFVITVKG